MLRGSTVGFASNPSLSVVEQQLTARAVTFEPTPSAFPGGLKPGLGSYGTCPEGHNVRHVFQDESRRVYTQRPSPRFNAPGNRPTQKEGVGHSDLRTTMQYTDLAREQLRSMVEQEPKREELRDLA